jgi:PIN domain nuclease of toxin-antitoxin system
MHAFLWAVADDPRLSEAARHAIETAEDPPKVSAVSFWEIAIKIAARRLRVDADGLLALVRDGTYLQPPIDAAHALLAGRLPRHHTDPFDRMLVAQALAEGLSSSAWTTSCATTR